MVGTRSIFLFLAATLLCACGASSGAEPEETARGVAEGGYPLVVEDDLGREVEIPSRPERVGSMAPSVTETLFALGAGERLAGVTTADDYPEEVEEIPEIGGYREPNPEKVLAEEIEVLFLSSQSATPEEAEEVEERTRAEVVVVEPETVEAAISSIGLVGRVVGEREEARALQRELRSELREIEAAVAGEPRPTVFFELWNDPLRTVGPGSFVHDAIVVAGGENVAAGTGESYPTYSVETLIKRDPDFYLVGSANPKEVERRAAYSSLGAVEEGRVKRVDADLVERPGPRVVEGVREISEAIHPEAFEGER